MIWEEDEWYTGYYRQNYLFENFYNHLVPTPPNHHRLKMDVLQKTFLQIILAAKWWVRHSSTSPNPQPRPLPYLLYYPYYMADVNKSTLLRIKWYAPRTFFSSECCACWGGTSAGCPASARAPGPGHRSQRRQGTNNAAKRWTNLRKSHFVDSFSSNSEFYKYALPCSRLTRRRRLLTGGRRTTPRSPPPLSSPRSRRPRRSSLPCPCRPPKSPSRMPP